jgi:hypothetical protein
LTLSLAGTPPDRYAFEILITDNGMPQQLVWGSGFAAMGVVGALPNATPAGRRMTLKFIYDADISTAMLAAIDGVGY